MTVPARTVALHPRGGYPICGRKKKQGPGICEQKAGWGTDHPGKGACKLHGGATPMKHGRYSQVADVRLGELLAELENDPAPLDVTPELQLMRALVRRFLERYDRTTAALLAWNETRGESERPVEVMRLDDVRPLVESITRIVARIEKAQSDRFIPRAKLLQLMQAMGRVVDSHVPEQLAEAIQEDWLRIQLP